jgi:hypothetical protein
MDDVYRCPVCEMPRDEWPDDSTGGYVGDNEVVYCCQGCATGSGCTCRGMFTREGRPPVERLQPSEQPRN